MLDPTKRRFFKALRDVRSMTSQGQVHVPFSGKVPYARSCDGKFLPFFFLFSSRLRRRYHASVSPG